MFGEKGYANATTREIAQAADVAEGTLYNYFANKRDILIAIAEETEAPMEAAVMAAGHIRDREALIRLIEQALDITVERCTFMRTVLAEALVDRDILQKFLGVRVQRIHRRLVALIEERVASGSFRPVDASLTAQMIIGAYTAVVLPAILGMAEVPGPERRRSLAGAIAGLLLEGLLVREG